MDRQAESSQQAEVGNGRTEEQIGSSEQGSEQTDRSWGQPGRMVRQAGWSDRQGSMNRQDHWRDWKRVTGKLWEDKRQSGRD